MSAHADVVITSHGSVALVRLHTEEAEAWWDEHVEEGMCLGDRPAVEARFVQPIINGLEGDGFLVEVA